MMKLDEEIENKENRAKKKQDESRVNMSPRKAPKGVQELARHGFEPGFLTKTVKRAYHRVARQTPSKRSEFVVHPNRKVITIAPNQSSAAAKRDVSKQRQ